MKSGLTMVHINSHRQAILSLPLKTSRTLYGCSSSPMGMGLQVLQMAWNGALLRVCSLGGGPAGVLGGALADRVLLVRGGPAAAPGGQAEVSQRHLPLLGPLLAGWASLAASNILPGGYVAGLGGEVLVRILCGAGGAGGE